jgi:large subunit ribosomal protein L25
MTKDKSQEKQKNPTLVAEVRKLEGRKVKTLRAQGIVPANVFGKKVKSLSVQVALKDFEPVFKDAGSTGIVELIIGSEKRPVLVHETQLNPKTGETLHIDFHQVDLKERIEADVPIEITGESPAEKQALGTVVQYLNEVKVEALPSDLPEEFVVDISNLTDVDQIIYIKDLAVDKDKVEIKAGEEEIVVKVEPPQKEEVVEAPVPAEGEAPVEGEAPAEGEPSEAENPQEEKSQENQG